VLSAVAKAYLVLAAVIGAFALAYLDPLSLSPKGGGDHFGGTLLVMAFIGTLAYAVVTSFRSVTDTDLEPPLPADAPPPTMRPVSGLRVGASAFPLVAAVGLVLVGVAAASGPLALYLGAAVLFVAAGGWLGQAFGEHPLATPRLGDRLSRRTTSPFTYPILAVLLGAVVAVSISRVYLTITEKAAIVVSGLVATMLFLGCLVLASGRDVGRRLTAGLAGLALVSIVGAGAASAARGERTIEHHAEGEVTDTELHAEGIQFNRQDLALTEGKVEFTFENDDPEGTYHNVGIYSEKEAGKPFAAILPIDGGGTRRSTLIDTKVVGLVPGTSYWFRCDFHPGMVGTLVVEPAPPPEEGGDHGGKTTDTKVEKH
jgi:plastocyanin